jgi:flagellar motor protein MotB
VNQTLTVALPGRLAFAPGSAELHPTAFSVLSDVAKAVRPVPVSIEVIGYADAVPVAAGSPYVDNWGLAAARAAATIRYLEGRGVPRERMRLGASVAGREDGDSRAVSIELNADTPKVGGDLYEQLSGRGLVPK